MFRMSMEHLGDHLKRLPDGEVGERDTWIRWQHKRIGQSPQIQAQEVDNIYVPLPPYEIVESVSSADEIEFPNLGYGDAAIASFEVFQKLTDEGVIAEDMRYMVGLPTPLSVAIFYVEPGSRDLFEQAYGRALNQEFEKILEKVPAEKLSIQWEVVSEFGLLEGLMENHLGDDLLEKITTRLAGLVDLVPQDVEAGIHLCYGDSGHKHFIEPTDTRHLVDVANGVAKISTRPIAWIHLPVPRERDDAAYYSPLADLAIAEDTELYLGLVHDTGGKEATRRRIKTATSIVTKFGIATECGFGRRDRTRILGLMDQHAEVLDAK
jgi:methionine synthase II (cobalamin-independent)